MRVENSSAHTPFEAGVQAFLDNLWVRSTTSINCLLGHYGHSIFSLLPSDSPTTLTTALSHAISARDIANMSSTPIASCSASLSSILAVSNKYIYPSVTWVASVAAPPPLLLAPSYYYWLCFCPHNLWPANFAENSHRPSPLTCHINLGAAYCLSMSKKKLKEITCCYGISIHL